MSATPRLTKAQLLQKAAAEAHLREGDFPASAKLAERLTAQAPHAADAWHIWALSLAQQGMREAACTPFSRAMALSPDDPHVLANFATALRGLARLDEAVELWRRATRVAPAFGQAWLDLGLTLLDLDRFKEARDALERATFTMPASASAWHGLGSALDALGHAEPAEAALREAQTLAPQQPMIRIHLGNLLRRQSRLDEALASYTEAQRISGLTPELLDARAGALVDAGRVDDAIATARRLTATYPRFAPGHRTLASILWEYGVKRGQTEDPLSCLGAAVDAYPGDTNLRLTYAQLLRSMGRGEAALGHVDVLRARDDHPLLRRFEADTLEALGRSEQAAALYHELYRRDSIRDVDFLNTYTRHLLKTGQWRTAADLAAETTSLDPYNQEAWAYRATAWRLLADAREYWLCDYERLVTFVELDAPPDYADTGSFLQALEAALLPLHQATREPMQQSLRQGTQTAGNLFGRPHPAIRQIEQTIRAAAEDWVRSLPDDGRHPFLGRKLNHVRMQGAWSVRLSSTGHHVDHIHQRGWISSAFYVSLPPVMRDAESNEGAIRFGQPPDDLGLNLTARRILHPRPGCLALFPSYMWHGTVPFNDTEPRLAVACDMTGRREIAS